MNAYSCNNIGYKEFVKGMTKHPAPSCGIHPSLIFIFFSNELFLLHGVIEALFIFI